MYDILHRYLNRYIFEKKNNKSKKRLSKFTMKCIFYNIKHIEKKSAFSLLNGFLV
jgi:hypothetical protein